MRTLNGKAILDAHNIMVDALLAGIEEGVEELKVKKTVDENPWYYVWDSFEADLANKVKDLMSFAMVSNPEYIRDFMMLVGEMMAIHQDGKARGVNEQSVYDSINKRIEFLAGGEVRAWVNVYHITREYGGAEEGGWWYDWCELVEAHNLNMNDAHAMVEKLKAEHGEGEGNISSVLGGYEVMIRIEGERAESQSIERPRYE